MEDCIHNNIWTQSGKYSPPPPPSPPVFQAIIAIVLWEFLNLFVIVYKDKILIVCFLKN